MLNDQTTHRFTGLYRYDQEVLHNLCFYDRWHPYKVSVEDVSLSMTYCGVISQSGEEIVINDAPHDARFAAHPARMFAQSYCGISYRSAAGILVGSLCHFDLAPTTTSPDAMELLKYFAQLLTERDQV